MKEYPLFFESGGPIFGNGYIVSVLVRGRVLATWDEDDREFVLRGVNPGSLLGFGATLNEAYQYMVESLRCVLIDIATDAATVEEFRREADDFFETGALQCRAEWQTARERAQSVETSGDVDHRVETSDPELGIFVEQIGTPSAAANAPAQRHSRGLKAACPGDMAALSTGAHAGTSGRAPFETAEGVEEVPLADGETEELLEDLRTARRVMREYREHGLTDTVSFTQFQADRLAAWR